MQALNVLIILLNLRMLVSSLTVLCFEWGHLVIHKHCIIVFHRTWLFCPASIGLSSQLKNTFSFA